LVLMYLVFLTGSFTCKELENYRNKSLPFLDDLSSFGVSNSEK